MSFPLDYHGDIKWKGNVEDSAEQIQERFLKKMDEALHRDRGHAIRIAGNMITFSGGINWLGFNYNATASVTTGFVEINQANDGFIISYHLNFKQMFVMSCIAASVYILFIFSALIFAEASDKPPIYLVIGYILIVPVGYTCINFPNAIWRFRGLLKGVLKNM